MSGNSKFQIPLLTAMPPGPADLLFKEAAFGTDWRVVKLLRSIESHDKAALWNLDYACRELNLGISSAHAARIFQLHTGQCVKEYAKKKRLLRAVEQLIATDLPIKAIASQLGYQKAFHLSRAFQKQFAVTPAKFRNAYRLKGISQQPS